MTRIDKVNLLFVLGCYKLRSIYFTWAFVLSLFAFVSPSYAYSIKLSWQPSPSRLVTGYSIFIRTSNDNSVRTIIVGNTSTFTYNVPLPGAYYYVAVASRTSSGQLSAKTPELKLWVPYNAQEYSSCVLYSGYSDIDRDGLPDCQEQSLGLRLDSADSDLDGESDYDELNNGTNPLDAGSKLGISQPVICVEWNSFEKMFNIFEHINTSITPISISTTVYTAQGQPLSTRKFSVPAQGQYDLLVHDFPGWSANKSGLVCSTFEGVPGTLLGRMVYYKPSSDYATSGRYDYALSLDPITPTKGTQFVQFNPLLPSSVTSPSGQADLVSLVTNWIQLYNFEASETAGTLIFYNKQGAVLNRLRLTLAPRSRRDIPSHIYAGSDIGLVQWSPNPESARFSLRSNRYYYSKDPLRSPFFSTLVLNGAKGSGQELVVPFPQEQVPSALEVSNTLNVTTSVTIETYYRGSSTPQKSSLTLPPFGTASIELSSASPDVRMGLPGFVTVSGSLRGSIVLNVVFYHLNSESLATIYAISGVEPLVSKYYGTYNSFLGQENTLLLVNNTSQPSSLALNIFSSQGKLINRPSIRLAPFDRIALSLQTLLGSNTYGSISIDRANLVPVSAWVLRTKYPDYRLALPFSPLGAP